MSNNSILFNAYRLVKRKGLVLLSGVALAQRLYHHPGG